MTDMTVARTILEQLGGHAFTRMTGAKNFIGDANSLTFRLPGGGGFCKQGINVVRITLTPADTYTVVFSRLRKLGGLTPIAVPVSTHTDIYADTLRELFSRVTGLCVSIPRVLFPKMSAAAQKAED